MRTRTIVFCLFAVVAAAVFIRLGFWQIARLHERQARNADVVRQQRDAATPVRALPSDTGAAHYRPATVAGRFDYEHELVLTNRSNNGSPGVELLTPVRVAGWGDTAVLVNRGWVYSPDGGTVDHARWREADSANVRGYVELYARDLGTTSAGRDPRIIRHVSVHEVAARVPYPLAPYYLVQTSDTMARTHPARRALPPLDEGSHRSYAFQWFCFALIALGGAAAVVVRERATAGGEG